MPCPSRNSATLCADSDCAVILRSMVSRPLSSSQALNGLRIIRISNNLGDSKSLITHPGTSTHQRLTDAERAAVGISPGSIRLSVGLEDAADLIEDLEQALGSF